MYIFIFIIVFYYNNYTYFVYILKLLKSLEFKYNIKRYNRTLFKLYLKIKKYLKGKIIFFKSV